MQKSMTSSTDQTTFITTYIDEGEADLLSKSDARPGLVFLTGYESGRVFMFEDRQIMTGRSDECQIQILEPDVSRTHALFDISAEGVEVIDMRSRNGVYVNGERVQRAWLSDQDLIRVGAVMTFKLVFLNPSELKFQEDLFNAAVHDSLTKLFNKRYFLGVFDKRMTRVRQGSSRMSLLALDLDFFKKLNDSYGHPVGDKALRHVADLIGAESRDMDVVCRFGGEEFMVLLHDVDLEGAVQIAERIRASIESRPLVHQDREIPITTSIGAACSNEITGAPDKLISLADTRLYRAKKLGRNQVCSQSVAGQSPFIVVDSPSR
ncbi:diguanylate cyclase (GGDEF)-like protein [Aestuariispira insulae]|uniref:diguanylate cyclase n=2 Tax=Aestuariispira insulae TaxID=1461337 RepID=A0A3D9H1G8_9PROT|nr:diguanylate cyclase (GGDEF)-like protein [Aestuariispira insulae]